MSELSASVNGKVETLVDKLKHNEPLTEELNSVKFEDRLNLAKEVKARMEQEQKQDASLPTLELTVGQDTQKRPHLVDIKSVASGKSRDLYDLPGKIEAQPLPIDLKLNLDAGHSRYLKTGGIESIRPQN